MYARRMGTVQNGGPRGWTAGARTRNRKRPAARLHGVWMCRAFPPEAGGSWILIALGPLQRPLCMAGGHCLVQAARACRRCRPWTQTRRGMRATGARTTCGMSTSRWMRRGKWFYRMYGDEPIVLHNTCHRYGMVHSSRPYRAHHHAGNGRHVNAYPQPAHQASHLRLVTYTARHISTSR